MAGTETGLVTLTEGLTVPITASAMTPPMCLASATCFESSFDFDAAMCVERERAPGSACTTNCITGTCSGATCVGQSRSCDDGDICTIDACDETLGCVTTPRNCQPPASPCLETRCDSRLGCVTENAPDGLICGRDDCLATQVDVCVAGACVTRPRPASARCVNRWVPTAPDGAFNSLGYDRLRGRVLMFGRTRFTWELTSSGWALRTPLARPPLLGPMFWSSARQRLLLFTLHEVWEWDGATWAQRPAPGLPPMADAAFAFDETRNRGVAVLARPNQGTWEWNGSQWSQLSPTGPFDAGLLHYDETRGRVVAPKEGVSWSGQRWEPFQTSAAPPCVGPFTRDWSRHRLVLLCVQTNTTWEWTGSTWVSFALGPVGGRINATMTYDATSRQVVLFGGDFDDTWAWNGATWQQLLGPTNPPWFIGETASLAWDSTRRSLVFGQTRAFNAHFWSPDGGRWVGWPDDAGLTANSTLVLTPDVDGGLLLIADSELRAAASLATWTLSGQQWTRRPTPIPSRRGAAVTTDQRRGRVVLFGSQEYPRRLDTWEWNGTAWAEVTASAPPDIPSVMSAHGTQVILQSVTFDGGSTWSWNGSTWSMVPTTRQPPPYFSAMAFDPLRQKSLLYSVLSDKTWEWDGVDWAESSIEDTPASISAPAMAFDETNQRMTLWNGSMWVLLR